MTIDYPLSETTDRDKVGLKSYIVLFYGFCSPKKPQGCLHPFVAIFWEGQSQ